MGSCQSPVVEKYEQEAPLSASLTDIGTKLTIDDVDMRDKSIFMRVDFNIPQDQNDPSIFTDTQRIEATLPTIKKAFDKGAKSVVLASHLGKPNGSVDKKFSLEPVAKILEQKLGKPVTFCKDCVGAETEATCTKAEKGTVILLENLRFHVEEEGMGMAKPEDVKAFRASLCKLADIYCNDAWGTAHRAHSSMLGTGYKDRCAGTLMSKELDSFSKVFNDPKRPVLAILGGSQVSDKMQLIMNLLDKVDKMIIGGGMAYTFLKVNDGMEIGTSLYDQEGAKIVPDIMAKAKALGVEILLPVDFVISSKFGEDGDVKQTTKETGIPAGFMGLDCGFKSSEIFSATVAASKTILWNGPLGVFEMTKFEMGTKLLMQAVVKAAEKKEDKNNEDNDGKVITVICGGDTATACKKYGAMDVMTHCSTGGCSSLELLEGKALPGVSALSLAAPHLRTKVKTLENENKVMRMFAAEAETQKPALPQGGTGNNDLDMALFEVETLKNKLAQKDKEIDELKKKAK